MNAHRLLALLLWLAVPAAAQDPLFTAVRLVHDLNTGTWGRFPTWKDTRSARGGIGRDDHLEVMLLGQGPLGPVTNLFLNDPSHNPPRLGHPGRSDLL